MLKMAIKEVLAYWIDDKIVIKKDKQYILNKEKFKTINSFDKVIIKEIEL